MLFKNLMAVLSVTAWTLIASYAFADEIGNDIKRQAVSETKTTTELLQYNMDRPGLDYKNFDLTYANPEYCKKACGEEIRCKAWSYIKPGVKGTNARCRLKSSVPVAETNTCCVSGVKEVEANADRVGFNYKSLDLAKADPVLCQKACSGDSMCKAWTYVEPSEQGADARCWLKSSIPSIQTSSCCISGVKDMEYDINRGGFDYKDFILAQEDPLLCQIACNEEAMCKAWTYLKPGVQGENARCRLKSTIPAGKPNSCCVSGVKEMEYDTNRPGLDYKNFSLTHADPALCKQFCSEEALCKSWTYTKPSVQGVNARCWLKSGIPLPMPSACCVSGLK
jgi:hypothetical protein